MSTDTPRRGELWVVMQARRLGYGRNPLRRSSDRWESAITVTVLLAALLMAPVGAAVGTSVRAASESRAAAQRVLLREVAARTVEDVPALTGQEIGRITWPALVVWQDEFGADHQVRTDVVLGTKADSEVTVWVDRAGQVVQAPRPSGDSEAIGFASGLGTTLGGWLVLWLLLLAARQPIERRRAADWASEWEQVAPRWTRHDS
jgi:hypothetical protein